MPATKPDLSLKLKEKLEVYNCFCIAKKIEIYRNRRSCSNCFSKDHATFKYSPMLARIAMRYVFSNQRIDRHMCSSNKAYIG
eukprot:300909-Pelagomonas_calceolata.AAC.1